MYFIICRLSPDIVTYVKNYTQKNSFLSLRFVFFVRSDVSRKYATNIGCYC